MGIVRKQSKWYLKVMKTFSILFLVALVSCTHKYVDYDLIRKVDFQKESYDRPTTLMQVLPNGQDQLGACFNQWLFFSNADRERNDAVSMIVRSLCPGRDYLLQARMNESWWTTILFTRACVDIKTLCGEVKKR